MAHVLVTGASGFIGGPIFPLFFVGGTMGTVISLVIPQVPPGLAIGALMAAVPAGILPVPIALGMYAFLIVGMPITEAIPLLVAGLTSFLITKGFGIGQRKHEQPPEPA